MKVMTPLKSEMILELKNERPAGCKFFFHHKGKMLRYQMIREEINKALIQKEAGLDTARAMLSHSSASQTEGNARLDVNEKVTGVILLAEKLFAESLTKDKL
jgi:hypothetical protein